MPESIPPFLVQFDLQIALLLIGAVLILALMLYNLSKSKKQNGTELPFLAPGASSSYVKDTLKTEQEQSIFRAIKLYNTHNGTSISANPDVTPLKLISYSRTGSSNGKEFSYSVSFSNDPSFIRSLVLSEKSKKSDRNISFLHQSCHSLNLFSI